MLWQGLPSDRRSLTDRRSDERRHVALPVAVERRTSGERRGGHDRRESAPGHVRNALQILTELQAHVAHDADGMQKLTAVSRRLWLALVEIERRAARDLGHGSRQAPANHTE